MRNVTGQLSTRFKNRIYLPRKGGQHRKIYQDRRTHSIINYLFSIQEINILLNQRSEVGGEILYREKNTSKYLYIVNQPISQTTITLIIKMDFWGASQR